MQIRTLVLTAIIIGGAAPIALGQDRTRPADKAPAQPAGKPAAEAPKGEPAKSEWPKPVEKELYGKDFRGKKAPEFVVEEVLSGAKPDREGKVVMIDFWATWCPPCRALIPELSGFQEKFKDDLVVIGVSDEQPAKVREFLKSNEARYAQAVDTKARMKKELGVQGIPHVIIISTDGVVRWQGFPGSKEEPLTAAIIRQVIEADPGVKERRERDAKKKEKGERPESAPGKPAEKSEDGRKSPAGKPR